MNGYRDCCVGDTLVVFLGRERVSARVVWLDRDYLLAELSNGAEVHITPQDFACGVVKSVYRQMCLEGV